MHVVMSAEDLLLILGSQIDIYEVILEEYFKLVIVELGRLLLFLLVEVEVELDLLHFLDGENGDGSEWLIAAGDGIASALEIPEALLGDLNPAVEVAGVDSCLILNQFTLEENFVVRVT